MEKTQIASGVPPRDLHYLEGPDVRALRRLDWGDPVQFYLIAHHWTKQSMHIISTIRLRHHDQHRFILALVQAGMPSSEAAYLNVLIEEEGIRRSVRPQSFGMVEMP